MHVFGFLLLLFSCIVQVLVSGSDCPSFVHCGDIGNLAFPFTTEAHPECGTLVIDGCDDEPGARKSIQNNNKWFDIVNVSLSQSTIIVRDNDLLDLLSSRSCEVLGYNSTETFSVNSLLVSSSVMYSANLLRCSQALNPVPPNVLSNHTVCNDTVFYGISVLNSFSYNIGGCSLIQLPLGSPLISKDPNVLLNSLTADIPIHITVSPNCSHCNIAYGGQCRVDNYGKFYCDKGTSQSCLTSEKFLDHFDAFAWLQLLDTS